MIALRLPQEGQEAFFLENRERQKKLQKHIERKRTKKFSVNSEILKKYGINPGKKFGELLQLTEEISFEYDLDDPQKILSILEKSWIAHL